MRVPMSVGAAVLACVAAILLATPAHASTPPPPGPLTVTSGGGDATRMLVPGATVVWPIDVTADVPELDSLLGRLSVSGDLARSGSVTAEIVSCNVEWIDDHCPTGAHTILSPTPLDQLPAERAALQPAPRPGTTHVQVRIRAASDALFPEDATMTAVLRVDATGQDATGGGGPSSHRSPDPTLSVSALANTGAGMSGYGSLALAAITAGLLLAGLAKLVQRRGRTSA